ncbi:helix-turn-helix domain-containing protein [Emcibacter sp. SYSU 3D8]|uniref:helix-turn-helix domain-containing protein n=1 Tax=Emcibacter sp. SYSU 3D8 TaxID=3133969 RepID=UPI0031FE6C1D
MLDEAEERKGYYRRKLEFVERMARDHELNAAALRVGIALTSFVNWSRGYAWPSLELLAERTGLARRSVIRAIELLVRHRWFEVERPDDGRYSTNNYWPCLDRENLRQTAEEEENPGAASSDQFVTSDGPAAGVTNSSGRGDQFVISGVTNSSGRGDQFVTQPVERPVEATCLKEQAADAAFTGDFQEEERRPRPKPPSAESGIARAADNVVLLHRNSEDAGDDIKRELDLASRPDAREALTAWAQLTVDLAEMVLDRATLLQRQILAQAYRSYDEGRVREIYHQISCGMPDAGLPAFPQRKPLF